MPQARHRVQILTYNGHLGQGMDLKNPDLSEWLIPTLQRGREEEKRSGEKGESPDFVAIGFQEMIPLNSSLLGLTKFAIDLHDEKLKRTLESNISPSTPPFTRSSTNTPETYTLLSKAVLGGIVLLVYSRDKTVTRNVVEVRVARAACGIFRVMGNKGAVGVRVVLDENPREGQEEEEDDEEDEEDDEEDSEISSLIKKKRGGKKERIALPPTVFTFVTTHLAAHDHGLSRRAEDYRSIVERLIFSPTSLSPHFRPSFPLLSAINKDDRGVQMYDTSYLFFFGDLNYRINIKEPKALALHVLSHKIINEGEELLRHDTLRQEQEKGGTLQGLKEGLITFRPTYKYKPGTISEFKKFTKRVPGWCDRILYATWADGPAGAGLIKKATTTKSKSSKELVEKKRKGVKVEIYKSIMEFTGSDHKPVTAIISLPRQPKPSRKNPPTDLRLVLKNPYAVDENWRRKQVVGLVLDRVVGLFWSLFMLLGFGRNAGFGFGNFSAIALAVWYYQENLRYFIS